MMPTTMSMAAMQAASQVINVPEAKASHRSMVISLQDDTIMVSTANIEKRPLIVTACILLYNALSAACVLFDTVEIGEVTEEMAILVSGAKDEIEVYTASVFRFGDEIDLGPWSEYNDDIVRLGAPAVAARETISLGLSMTKTMPPEIRAQIDILYAAAGVNATIAMIHDRLVDVINSEVS